MLKYFVRFLAPMLFLIPSLANTALAGGPAVSVVGATNGNMFNESLSGIRVRASDTAEAGTTTTVIVATSHIAQVGDIIVARNASSVHTTTYVTATTANSITVFPPMVAAMSPGDTFTIGAPTTHAVDSNLSQMCGLYGSNGATAIFLEDNAHASGDNGIMSLGVANTGFTAFAANGDYTPMATNLAGAQYVDINFSAQSSANGANALLKLEDSAHSSGDAGVLMFGVRNDAVVQFGGSGDYTPISLNQYGASYSVMSSAIMSSTDIAASFLKQEDVLSATGDGGVGLLAVAQDPIAIDAGTNNDYANVKTTRGGKLQVAFAPATEYWKSCGTATATTSDVAIKAAVASNKIYVSSISCKNTSTTQNSNLDFKDGSTTFAVGSIGAFVTGTSQPGTFTQQFPVPAQLTSATALNFATNTATSSVTCCANGFISVD